MFNPIPLNLPNFPFKITQREELYFIFDEIRKKHLVLTPEEWVRQHFVKHLILNAKPEIITNERNKKADAESKIAIIKESLAALNG